MIEFLQCPQCGYDIVPPERECALCHFVLPPDAGKAPKAARKQKSTKIMLYILAALLTWVAAKNIFFSCRNIVSEHKEIFKKEEAAPGVADNKTPPLMTILIPQAPAPAPVQPPPAAPLAAPLGEWSFEGLVYDMISLKPITYADLVFSVPNIPKRHLVHTDSKGRYQIRLPALANGSYSLKVRHMDYRPDYFDEIQPPFREQTLSDRKAFKDVAPTFHRPWSSRPGRKTVRDLVLFPDIIPHGTEASRP